MRRIEAPKEVQKDYQYWCDFLEKQVDFSLEASELHTREHCSRVLLFSLLLAHELQLSDSEREMLCHAAVFHDTRRHDDWLDVGHGRRAAEHYQEFCRTGKLNFHAWTYDIMAYHDLKDDFGYAAMEGDYTGREKLLYQIFKDADALDRFRLGPNGLDVKYLRTDAARNLYDYAKSVWNQYVSMDRGEII